MHMLASVELVLVPNCSLLGLHSSDAILEKKVIGTNIINKLQVIVIICK